MLQLNFPTAEEREQFSHVYRQGAGGSHKDSEEIGGGFDRKKVRFPSFSVFFNREMQSLPLCSGSLLRNDGENGSGAAQGSSVMDFKASFEVHFKVYS